MGCLTIIAFLKFLWAPIAISDPRCMLPNPVLQPRGGPGVHHGVYAAVVDTRQHAAAKHPGNNVSENQCNDLITL